MNTYEVMFLFDPAVGANWETVEKEIERLMSRAEGELIVTNKLEERKLAYEIQGRKRGLYVLCYFRADAQKIVSLERDIKLSELVLRAIILRVEGYSEEKMRSATLGGGFQERSPQKADASSQPTKPEAESAKEKTEEKPKAQDSPPAESTEPPAELVASSTEESKTSEPEA